MSAPITNTPICPICKLPSRVHYPFTSWPIFECPRCRHFRITQDLVSDLPLMGLKDASIGLLSHFCCRAQLTGQQATIDQPFVDRVLKESLPNPAERLDNLILTLGRADPDGGSFTFVHPQRFQGLIGAATPAGVGFIASEAICSGLAVNEKATQPNGNRWYPLTPNAPEVFSGAYELRLTMAGWRRYEELTRSGGVGAVAFLAMKFGDATLDQLVEDHLRAAVKKTGFTLRRLDDRPKAGLIDDRLRVEIRACRFLLADLIHANLGAYWEAGFAEGLGKPVVYLCKKSIFVDPVRQPHFDTKATIRFSIPEARQTDP
jgi:hypothetical protein